MISLSFLLFKCFSNFKTKLCLCQPGYVTNPQCDSNIKRFVMFLSCTQLMLAKHSRLIHYLRVETRNWATNSGEKHKEEVETIILLSDEFYEQCLSRLQTNLEMQQKSRVYRERAAG